MNHKQICPEYDSHQLQLRDIIIKLFNHLQSELTGVPASNTWNYDETNLIDDTGIKNVVSKQDIKSWIWNPL